MNMKKTAITLAVGLLTILGLVAVAHLIDLGGVVGVIRRMHGG